MRTRHIKHKTRTWTLGPEITKHETPELDVLQRDDLMTNEGNTHCIYTEGNEGKLQN